MPAQVVMPTSSISGDTRAKARARAKARVKDKARVKARDKVKARVRVKAVRHPARVPVDRPVKLLRAFDKVALEAGETKTVPLSVEVKELAWYNPDVVFHFLRINTLVESAEPERAYQPMWPFV